MGLYADHVLPRGVAFVMGRRVFTAQRGPALADVTGRVLELGFGAGHNLRHYPRTVTEVLALEPAALNRRLARARVARSAIPVRWLGLRAEEIPLDDSAVDAVVSTWTLCTIPDVCRALGEVRRVLRPGGALHFLEHGLSPDPRVQRWQHRLNPVWRRCCGGCDLTRRIDRLLGDAGFAIRELAHPRIGGPRITAHLYRGVAVPVDGERGTYVSCLAPYARGVVTRARGAANQERSPLPDVPGGARCAAFRSSP